MTALGTTNAQDSRYVSKLIILLGVERVKSLQFEAQQLALQEYVCDEATSATQTVRDRFFALAVCLLNRTQHLIVFGPSGWQDDNIAFPAAPLPADPPPRRSTTPVQHLRSTTPVQHLTLAERQAAIVATGVAQGFTQSVIITLTGRLERVTIVDETIIALLTDVDAPQLPMELAASPAQYVVYITARRWKRVAKLVTDSSHLLKVTGWTAYDPSVRRMVVFAQQVGTTRLQM
jgi:hypothetical protein